MTEENKLRLKISNINIKMVQLSIEKRELEKQLLNSYTTDIEKFIYWLHSDQQSNHLDLITFRTLCPLTSTNIENRWDLDRCKTYDLTEWFGDDFYWAFEASDEELVKANIKREEYVDIIPVGIELMNANVKSFTYDW